MFRARSVDLETYSTTTPQLPVAQIDVDSIQPENTIQRWLPDRLFLFQDVHQFNLYILAFAIAPPELTGLAKENSAGDRGCCG